jgi:hypothetical protein
MTGPIVPSATLAVVASSLYGAFNNCGRHKSANKTLRPAAVFVRFVCGGAMSMFDFRKLDREKLLLYAQKYPRPVKFGLLESLAHTGAVLPNGKSATLHEIKS